MVDRQPITFANAQPDLPGGDFADRLRELRIARLFAANSNELGQPMEHAISIPQESDEPSMVEQDRPYPAPRPSPDLAADVDAAAFYARWEAGRHRAAQSQSIQSTQGERPMSDDTTPQRRPEDTLHEGPLKAAIWRNEGEHGAYHSVTVARTYKDQEGKLHDTRSFRAKDMLGLSELARRAHHSAHDLDRAAFKEQRREGQEQAHRPHATRELATTD